MSAREVHFRAVVLDDGKVEYVHVFREDHGGERLSPREWHRFKISMLDQLPEAIDQRMENER